MSIAIALVFAALAAAQPIDRGYVVRVDSNTVWLDLTTADGASPRRTFEIYTEGTELKHPITGASLGWVQNEVATGEVANVADKFSTGVILSHKTDVKLGQRVRFLTTAPVPSAAPQPATRSAETGSRSPKFIGATVPYEINAMAVGDFSKTGQPQIALASENSVRLYSYPMADAKPIAELTLPEANLRIVGLESSNLDSGGDKLFVSLYDGFFKRFETRVLGLREGHWLPLAELPFLTRAYQDGTGKRVLATQQIADDGTFPFGALYPLVYQDGKYAQGRPALKFPRAHWVYGFTTAQIGSGETSAISITNVHRLRLQFGKHSWSTPDDDYGQTPVRVRWHDRLLEFNPPLTAIYGPSRFESLYATRNLAAFGGLAAPFGLFNHAELVSKRWNGLSLETAWKADLSGCAQGLSVIERDGRKEIAVAIRGSAGQSSVWTFDP